MLKFISWNVNGLRACYDKGFVDVFHRLEADFFLPAGNKDAGRATGCQV